MPDTSVKWFLSSMAGAPAISGTAGAGISVLNACLVNGFGSVTANSLVVASSVATATVSTGHGFSDGVVVLIGGASDPALNGEKRLINISPTQFIFSATGASDQTATGTITAKMAPLGWEKAFDGTNLAVYRGIAGDWVRPYLRIDDTGTFPLYARIYEAMSDVSTGDNPVPTVAMSSTGVNWKKSDAATTAARNWAVIGDGRFFYLGINTNNSTIWHWYYTGALAQNTNLDLYAVVLSGNRGSGNASDDSNPFGGINNNGSDSHTYLSAQWMLRSKASAVGGVNYLKQGMFVNVSPTLGSTSSSTQMGFYGPAYSEPLQLSQVLICENSLHGAFRGLLPGLGAPLQSLSGAGVSSPQVWSGVYPGSAIVSPCSVPGVSQMGYCAFDIEGPWR